MSALVAREPSAYRSRSGPAKTLHSRKEPRFLYAIYGPVAVERAYPAYVAVTVGGGVERRQVAKYLVSHTQRAM